MGRKSGYFGYLSRCNFLLISVISMYQISEACLGALGIQHTGFCRLRTTSKISALREFFTATFGRAIHKVTKTEEVQIDNPKGSFQTCGELLGRSWGPYGTRIFERGLPLVCLLDGSCLFQQLSMVNHPGFPFLFCDVFASVSGGSEAPHPCSKQTLKMRIGSKRGI